MKRNCHRFTCSISKIVDEIALADPTASALASRLMDIELSGRNTPATFIIGLSDTVMLSLADAIAQINKPPYQDLGVKLRGAAEWALYNACNFVTLGNLTVDQAAAIHIYSMPTPLYPALNTALRNEDRATLKSFFHYLRLFLSGIYQLPMQSRQLYRGVKANLATQFVVGQEVVWWSITSATSKLSVLSNPDFMGSDGDRTQFIITAIGAIDISAYSRYPAECECILLPGTVLKVEDVLDAGHGLQQVKLTQVKRAGVMDYVHPEM